MGRQTTKVKLEEEFVSIRMGAECAKAELAEDKDVPTVAHKAIKNTWKSEAQCETWIKDNGRRLGLFGATKRGGVPLWELLRLVLTMCRRHQIPQWPALCWLQFLNTEGGGVGENRKIRRGKARMGLMIRMQNQWMVNEAWRCRGEVTSGNNRFGPSFGRLGETLQKWCANLNCFEKNGASFPRMG